MSVCCEHFVLSGRDIGDVPIPRPEGSYRLWCAIVCALQTSSLRGPGSCWAAAPETKQSITCCNIREISISSRRVFMRVIFSVNSDHLAKER